MAGGNDIRDNLKVPMALRVLYINCGDDQLAGSEVSLLGMLDMLRPAGDAWVYCNSPVLADAARARGAEAEVIPMAVLSPWGRLGRDLHEYRRAVAALRSVIRRVRPDLIHANMLWANQLAVAAAVGTGTPVLCHVRAEVIRSGVELSLCRFAFGVLAASKYVAQAVERSIGTGRVDVFYDPVECDDPVEIPRTIEADPAVVVVSRLSKEKGVDRALELLAWLIRQGYRNGMVLIGDGAEMPNLRQQCLRLNLTDRVQFRGYQARPFAELPVSSVLLVPSRREGFGRVVIEAALRGIPALVCRTGGLPETVASGEAGYILDDLESEESRRRALGILRNTRSLRAMSEKAAAFARKEFGAADRAQQLLSIYHQYSRTAGGHGDR